MLKHRLKLLISQGRKQVCQAIPRLDMRGAGHTGVSEKIPKVSLIFKQRKKGPRCMEIQKTNSIKRNIFFRSTRLLFRDTEEYPCRTNVGKRKKPTPSMTE